MQLIKAEDGGQINSKFKLIARKQTNFLVRCSYIYKNIIRDGELERALHYMLYAVDTIDTVLSKEFVCNGLGDTL